MIQKMFVKIRPLHEDWEDVQIIDKGIIELYCKLKKELEIDPCIFFFN